MISKFKSQYGVWYKVLFLSLCLIMVVSFISQPLTVHAAGSYSLYEYYLMSSLIANGFDILADNGGFKALSNAWRLFDPALEYLENSFAGSVLKLYVDVQGRNYLEYDEDIQRIIMNILTDMTNPKLIEFRSKLYNKNYDLGSIDSVYRPSYGDGDPLKDVLLKDGFVPIPLQTRIYIPSQELVQSGSLITQDQILSGDFEQVQVPGVASPTVTDYLRELSLGIQNLSLKFDNLITYFGSRLQEYSYEIDSKLTNFSKQVSLDLGYLSDRLTDYLQELSRGISDLQLEIDLLTSYMRTEVIEEIRETYKQIQLLSPTFDSIVTELQILNKGFVLPPNYFEDLKTTFQDFNALQVVPSVNLVYQKVDQLISYMRTEVLWEIRDVTLKVGTLKTTFETKIEDLALSLGQIYDTLQDLPDLVAQKTAEAIWVQQLLDTTPIQTVKESFLNVTQSLTYLPQFLSPSDDDQPTFFDFLFGRGEGAGLWEYLSDLSFVAAIKSFFTFVASLWYVFPAAVRYFVSFGFAFPFFFSTLKMFAG